MLVSRRGTPRTPCSGQSSFPETTASVHRNVGMLALTGANSVKASIPTFLWTEAVVSGKELCPEQGVRGVPRLDTSIKLIYAVASNALVNQHANINRTAK